jgi:hypothetical protein
MFAISMEGVYERRAHFRGAARPGVVVPVRFRIRGAPWVLAFTRNVGTGGLFINSALAMPVGSELDVELTLTGLPSVLRGVVRWTSVHGMGIEFVAVAPEVVLDLADYFAQLPPTKPRAT